MLKPLQALQNRAARIIARTDRSSPAMDILKWPSLADRRRNNIFKLLKNVLKGVVPNILRIISNVMVVFTSVQQGKRTNFTFLLQELKLRRDLSIIMAAPILIVLCNNF